MEADERAVSIERDRVELYATDDAMLRVGRALREIRRGATSMRSIRRREDRLPPGQQFDALGVLVIEHPSGCRMSELARALRVDASTATHAVDRLAARGLAERRRSGDDGRAMLVGATGQGRALYLETSMQFRERLHTRIGTALTPSQTETLADLLERVIAVFDEMSADENGSVSGSDR